MFNSYRQILLLLLPDDPTCTFAVNDCNETIIGEEKTNLFVFLPRRYTIINKYGDVFGR